MTKFFPLFLTVFFVSLVLTGCATSQKAAELREIGFEWVELPGGPFLMGDVFSEDNQDAKPPHTVPIQPFLLSKYETTLGQYDWFTAKTGRPTLFPEQTERGTRAANKMSWFDAVAFCEFIGGRLPSEAEWEYAAAGGPLKQLFPGTNQEEEVGEYVRYQQNSLAEVFPVGTKKANAFGVFDMGGNVAEWIGEFYEYYPAPGETPILFDLPNRELRIVRGGGFSADLILTRTYWRAGTLARVAAPGVGFRCARDLK